MISTTPHCSLSYRISERVTLEPGCAITVRGGPKWVSEDGRKMTLPHIVRGQAIFAGWTVDQAGNTVFLVRQGSQTKPIVYVRGDGNKSVDPHIQYEPYRISRRR